MADFVTPPARSPDFQRAFLALRYFWGARGEALAAGLGARSSPADLSDLLVALTHEAREVRARALGVELGRLAAALEQRGLVK